MAGSKSDYLEKVVLDTFIGGQAYSAPANLYIALYTTGTVAETATGTTSGATEVSGGSYARASVANDLTQWPAASGTPTLKSNANTISFTTATTDWGTITQWAICDAATDGNVLYYGTFDVAKTILTGDTATLPAGALKIYED